MRFYISLLVFSIIIFAGIYFAQSYLSAKVAYPSFFIIQLIMIAATVTFHTGLARASSKSGQVFVRYFMGATSMKLLVFMMIIVVYALINRSTAFAFILHFLIFYMLYTVFEVYFAYKHFGPAEKKS